MYVGANWPYDGHDIDFVDYSTFLAMKPNEITIMSNTNLEVVNNLIHSMPRNTIWHVRAKTGPQNLGHYPKNILKYTEYDNEVSLYNMINHLLTFDITPYVILGNEPDIEMATVSSIENEWYTVYVSTYCSWYIENYDFIKRIYGDWVYISPAPLSQGNYSRFLTWNEAMERWLCYRSADFIAEHCYIGEPSYEWIERFFHFKKYTKPIHITEVNDNGTGRNSSMYSRLIPFFEEKEVHSVSFFTIEGGANTKLNRPEWWFITPEEANIIGQRFENNKEGGDVILSNEVTIVDGFVAIWHAVRTTPYVLEDGDYTGIFKVWSRNPKIYGSPVSDEFSVNDEVYQAFTNGVYKYSNNNLVQVNSGL